MSFTFGHEGVKFIITEYLQCPRTLQVLILFLPQGSPIGPSQLWVVQELAAGGLPGVETAVHSWNNYVWKNPPDWGWEKVFGTSDVMGGRLGVDNHETYTETTRFGLNITGPTSNIWAAPMVNKTNEIVFLGHTDVCNHASWASPHACESHSGPGTYGSFNENFHEMAYPGLVHLHDMNGDGYIVGLASSPWLTRMQLRVRCCRLSV